MRPIDFIACIEIVLIQMSFNEDGPRRSDEYVCWFQNAIL
jgi:hypothetical protein